MTTASQLVSRYAFENLRVLTLDDNKNMTHIVSTILRALGLTQIHESNDPNEAFEEFKLNSPDLIIVDGHMQPVSGVEFVERVRTASDSPNPYVPILMLSGHTEVRYIKEARDAGINAFIAKPISATAFAKRLVYLLENPRPFVRTQKYFGPDRRNEERELPRGFLDRRRQDPRP